MKVLLVAILLLLGACASSRTLVYVPITSAPQKRFVAGTVDGVRTCIWNLPFLFLGAIRSDDLIVMKESPGELTVGTRAIPVGPAISYEWLGETNQPQLFASFRVRFGPHRAATVMIETKALSPVVWIEKPLWTRATSRYRYNQVPVTAEVESSIVTKALAECVENKTYKNLPFDKHGTLQEGRTAP